MGQLHFGIVQVASAGKFPSANTKNSRAGTPETGTENFGRSNRDTKTGEDSWEYKLPFGGYAPPAVYEAGDRPFVVIAATGGGKLGEPMGDAWIAFALPK